MKTKNEKIKETLLGILTFALWLGAAALGFYVVVNLQEMVFRIYVVCCADNRWGFTVTKQWSSIFFMLFWVSFIVWLGDYQAKRFNEPKSWKIFGWTYLVMIVLLVISWLM
jgi:hypothetical protein